MIGKGISWTLDRDKKNLERNLENLEGKKEDSGQRERRMREGDGRILGRRVGERREKIVSSLLIENSSALAILIKGWKFSARSIG